MAKKLLRNPSQVKVVWIHSVKCIWYPVLNSDTDTVLFIETVFVWIWLIALNTSTFKFLVWLHKQDPKSNEIITISYKCHISHKLHSQTDPTFQYKSVWQLMFQPTMTPFQWKLQPQASASGPGNGSNVHDTLAHSGWPSVFPGLWGGKLLDITLPEELRLPKNVSLPLYFLIDYVVDLLSSKFAWHLFAF